MSKQITIPKLFPTKFFSMTITFYIAFNCNFSKKRKTEEIFIMQKYFNDEVKHRQSCDDKIGANYELDNSSDAEYG